MAIRVGAVVLRNGEGDVLTVRKQGATLFQLPGGKPEGDETMRQTVVREAAEEVGVQLDPAQLEFLGDYTAQAANEPGHEVSGAIYTYPGELAEEFSPHSEIRELKWAHPVPGSPGYAPLLATRVFPALGRQERLEAVDAHSDFSALSDLS
ncbi:MAG: NUDIX hydrolase [Ancrocorticia sp.]|uniref:NUDIX hydrolase n=1 Tax=Ancrocorticia sp. TaxID=2593684 RepID=UPI003F92E8B2